MEMLSSRTRTVAKDRDGRAAGFALPAAILAVVVVGVLLTGGIQIATQEFRIGQATERATEAFYVAESGMNTVLGDWRPANANLTPWSDPAVVTGQSGQGRWEAQIRQVDDRLFFVRVAGGLGAGAGGATAQRAVGILARVLSANLEPQAALVTMGSVRVAGSAQLRGADQIPSDWDAALCPDAAENLPGLVTDVDGSLDLDGGATVSGSPTGHVLDPSVTEDSFTQFGDMSWEDLVSLATLTLSPGQVGTPAPSFVGGECNYGDVNNWGDPSNPDSACGDYFPIVHIAGAVTVEGNGRGQGILLVDGDLDLRGGFLFNGVIIVQGALGVQGGGATAPRIYGGVFARNADLDLQSFVGSSIVQNSRCAIRRAVANNASLTRLAPIAQRGWVDMTGASF
jgi:hypothetical protein